MILPWLDEVVSKAFRRWDILSPPQNLDNAHIGKERPGLTTI